ncbi:30S ribosomal protein S8 [candidate division KSB1 bacterium]|nr:30S ribosomal protein S8 [candidate division KSB1 bacterium]
MSMTDPIADYLTRIRNAAKARHSKVDIPASKVKREITRILRDYQYINNFINIDDGLQGIIRIYLKYDENDNCVITRLSRVSKPGLRKYVDSKEIPSVLNNLGIAILSTPKGIITNNEAKKLGVGGEVLCYIW